MVDHIELMMRTAGVKPHCQTEDGTGCKYCQKDYSCKLHRNRADCSYILDGWDFNFYPDFTTEKQLNIIILMMQLNYFEGRKSNLSKKYIVKFGNLAVDNKDFTQALAELTTELMKANELDKEKVKGILEG